jgi:hypothetical protein
MMATQKEATLRLYRALNSPAKAGMVWVQYERKTIDAALDVLKQMMVAQGCEFRPVEPMTRANAAAYHGGEDSGF